MGSKEYIVTYDMQAEKEMLPAPKFEGIWWQGSANESQVMGQSIVVNGTEWIMDVVGFQGTDIQGASQLHQEKNQEEDIFFISGAGVMYWWDGLECTLSTNGTDQLKEVLNLEETQRAKYTLAVASYRPTGLKDIELEHLVLNIEIDGRTIVVEPAKTPRGYYHKTKLTKPSFYLVTKRRQANWG